MIRKKTILSVITLFVGVLIITTMWVKYCGKSEVRLVKVPVPSAKLFMEDLSDKESLARAIDKQITLFQAQLKAEQRGKKPLRWDVGDRIVGVRELLDSLNIFRKLYFDTKDNYELRDRVARLFDCYKMGGAEKKNVLFTGYYSPVINASLTPDDRFRFPLYRKPDDLITVRLGLFSRLFGGKRIVGRYNPTNKAFVPYYTREEIDWGGALKGRNLEIAWLEDYIDQFFLHVQGGGILQFKDGSRINVNYAGKNGHPFVSLGKLLLQDGVIDKEKMSMQAIREYFKNHPDKIRFYCAQNPSYVFYETGANGPYGSLGAVVTPGRSIATDKRYYVGGQLCLISGRIPIADPSATPPLAQHDFNRFVIDQDTGGAIRNAHIDVYCGVGDTAAAQAGSLMCKGDVYFLILKPK